MAATTDRAARRSLTVIFFLTGAVVAGWSTRVPAIQHQLHLSPAALGVAVLGLELGAVAGLPAGAALVARFGSRRSLRAAFLVYPTALVGAAIAPGLALLATALAVMAAANSVVDVAMNVQGVELERRYRRPILSSLHAGHSLGLLAGSLAGTAAAAAGLTPAVHFAATAAAGVLGGVAATGRLVDDPARRHLPTFRRPSRSLLLLSLVAFGGFFLDGAAVQWSAVHLDSTHQATPALAAAAFTAFALALAVGRLTGLRLTVRIGPVRVVQLAGATAVVGAVVAVAGPTVIASLAGWAVFGLGLSVVAPTVLGAAARAGSTPAPVAIAGVTTIGYLGSFTVPPLIGTLAGLSSVGTALWSLVAVAAAVALLARPALSRGRPSAP